MTDTDMPASDLSLGDMTRCIALIPYFEWISSNCYKLLVSMYVLLPSLELHTRQFRLMRCRVRSPITRTHLGALLAVRQHYGRRSEQDDDSFWPHDPNRYSRELSVALS